MHLEELIGASHFTGNGVFRLAFNPSDPRYRDHYSGWYWEVQQSGKTLKRSMSLGEDSLNLKTATDDESAFMNSQAQKVKASCTCGTNGD